MGFRELGFNLNFTDPALTPVIQAVLDQYAENGTYADWEWCRTHFPAAIGDMDKPPLTKFDSAKALCDALRKDHLHFEFQSVVSDYLSRLPDFRRDDASMAMLAVRVQDIVSAHASVSSQTQTFSQIAKALEDRYISLENGEMVGYMFPIPFVQNILNGLFPAEVTVVAGRPGAGKTWVVLHTVKSVCDAGGKVLLVSLEMSPEQIGQRMAAMLCRLDFDQIRRGALAPAEREAYFAALHDLSERKIYPNLHFVGPSVAKSPEHIHGLANSINADFVAVDSFYHLPGPFDERWQNVQRNIGRIRQISLDRERPRHYLLSSQFNREMRGFYSAETDALAFSDAIGQDANNVIALMQTPSQKANRRFLVKITKARDAASGMAYECGWNFKDMVITQLQQYRPSGSQGASPGGAGIARFRLSG